MQIWDISIHMKRGKERERREKEIEKRKERVFDGTLFFGRKVWKLGT